MAHYVVVIMGMVAFLKNEREEGLVPLVSRPSPSLETHQEEGGKPEDINQRERAKKRN